jgi:Cu(I)/Ag(I) efflux system membrane fusion protein
MQMTKWRVEKVLSIPETAVVDTGVRQYVFVEKETGLFDARRVTLGPRAGAYFPVLGGLAPGDRIVTRGSFLIDAEARLNPAGFVEPEGGPPAKQAAPAPAPSPHAGHTQVP